MRKFIPIVFILVGCVEYYDPSIEQPDDQPIIIDALLTNELKHHQITISRARYIDRPFKYNAIDNAEVYIEDSDGVVYPYNYSQNGTYTSQDMFSAEQTLQYRLVATIDEKQYLSDFQPIHDWGEIINIKSEFVYETTETEPGVFSDQPRIEFLVDLELNSEDIDSYFRFDWEATYSAETPDQGDTICWSERDQENPSDLTVETCYVTENPTGFLRIHSTEGLITGKNIDDFRIYSVHPNKRFQSRYSPEVTMYSISKSSYEFWELILNQNDNTGGLFDPALSPINGNIRSESDGGERVIGFFEVANVSKIRGFFTRSVANIEMTDYDRDCDIPPSVDLSGNLIIHPRPYYCCDCTKLPNSTNVKPDFW